MSKCARWLPIALLSTVFTCPLLRAELEPHLDQQLQTAYDEIYDQKFQAAGQTLKQYKTAHPNDPMGPLSEAAMYMLQQFHRLGILEKDFFSGTGKIFAKKPEQIPDPELAHGFNQCLEQAQKEAQAALHKSPKDVNALLANSLAMTLRADYDALVEDHGWQALKEIEGATGKSHDLLSICPHCYDAYLASGVENYILGQQSEFARFFLHLGGAQTDEQKGIKQLRMVAGNGNYFKTYAKLLLAIAAKRQKDQPTAKELMSQLATEYPDNTLFREALKSLS